MSDYAWIIDKDYLSIPGDEYDDTGLIGPHNPSSEYLTLEQSKVGQQFRLFDDDNVLCYQGRIIGNYSGFEPLDDYGTPNAGCTTIKYRNGHAWEVL
jgi:hypothetical protein